MACFNSNMKLSKQMIIKFGLVFGLFILAMLIICISIVIGTNNTVKKDSENALYSQIERNVKKVIAGS